MVARMPRTIVLHKTFPGRRAFIPSNPVREKSVPRYAASERRQKGGLESGRHASNSGSGGLGSHRAPGSEPLAGPAVLLLGALASGGQSRSGTGDGSGGTIVRPQVHLRAPAPAERGRGPHAVREAGYQLGTRPQLACGPPRRTSERTRTPR